MRHRYSSNLNEFDCAVFALSGIRLEHKRIFALVGEFLGLVKVNAETSRLLNLLERIIIQTSEHCRSEEDILAQRRSPNFEMQRKTHHCILEELATVRDNMAVGRCASNNEYLHLLDPLIIHHVSDEVSLQGLDELIS